MQQAGAEDSGVWGPALFSRRVLRKAVLLEVAWPRGWQLAFWS